MGRVLPPTRAPEEQKGYLLRHMEFFKENWFKLIISATLLLAVLSVSYYYMAFLPHKEAKRVSQLGYCLAKASVTKFNDWDNHCERLEKRATCNLPSNIADGVNERYEANENICFKKYPSTL